MGLTSVEGQKPTWTANNIFKSTIKIYVVKSSCYTISSRLISIKKDKHAGETVHWVSRKEAYTKQYFHPSLIFEGWSWRYIVHYSNSDFSIHKMKLKSITKDKLSSLLSLGRSLINFSRGQCYKNTTVNYCGNFNPTFNRVKMTFKNDLGLKNITAILD